VYVVVVIQELVVETIDRQGNTRPQFLMYDIMQFEVSVTKNRTEPKIYFTQTLFCVCVLLLPTILVYVQCVHVCLCL